MRATDRSVARIAVVVLGTRSRCSLPVALLRDPSSPFAPARRKALRKALPAPIEHHTTVRADLVKRISRRAACDHA